MAYSLNDPYRLYRIFLRLNATLTGLGLGLLLLAQPQILIRLWDGQGQAEAVLWTLRLSGAGLTGMGVTFWEISARAFITRLASLAIMLSSGLLAAILFGAYVSGALAVLTGPGRLVLLLLFLCQLACVIIPLAYLGDDLTP